MNQPTNAKTTYEPILKVNGQGSVTGHQLVAATVSGKVTISVSCGEKIFTFNAVPQ